MKTVYQCEYCPDPSGGWDKADQCLLHEVHCKWNPVNRCCESCRHLHIDDTDAWDDEDNYKPAYSCSALEAEQLQLKPWRTQCPAWKGKP